MTARSRFDEALAALRGFEAPGKGLARMAPGAAENGPVASGTAGQPEVLQMIANYQKYLQRSGMEREPLSDFRMRRTGPRSMTEVAPARLLAGADGSSPFTRTEHGPRAGQLKQSYELPDGRKANVYYDERGRRKVFVFGGPPDKGVPR